MNKPLCIVLALLALLPAFAADEIKPLPLGAKAPPFTLPGVDGRTYSLDDFAHAKILMVVFTCNHCPTAQYYENRLKKIVVDYKDKGVALVAISPNDPKSVRLDELGYTDLSDSFDEMKIRAQHRQFNFPYLYDGDSESASTAYGPTATPHVFIFDANRTLQYAGRIDDSERPEFVATSDARNALDALLAGQPIPIKDTKTFGCSVKWKGKEDSVQRFMQKLATEPVTVEPIDAQSLKSLRSHPSGKLRLVNFWATWCGPCITEFPEFITINRMYRHRAFELITVAANYPDEQPAVLAFLQKQQASNRNYIFASNDKYKLMENFDPDWNNALPYTLLISATGQILYRKQGPVDPLQLKRLIVQNLKEDRFK